MRCDKCGGYVPHNEKLEKKKGYRVVVRQCPECGKKHTFPYFESTK